MLLLDPGLGKTAITLSAFLKLKKKKVAHRMLVIAPLRVANNVWPYEAKEWAQFSGLRVAVLHGKNKEAALETDADIFVINPEGLDWLLGGGGFGARNTRFSKLKIDTLVVDELTKFKKPSGKRFKLLKSVIHTFARRWGLTGTPAPKSLLDLFGQCFIIDEGNALGRYITHYRSKYFKPLDGNGWKWALQPGADELIYARLAPLALRMAAEDYLNMPEPVPLKHYVDLPPKVRDMYDAVEEDLLAKWGGNLIVAGNAAAASTKCRQIANGAVYVDDDMVALVGGKRRTVMTLHELKLDAVEELLNELQGNQLLLAYEFNHDLEALQRRFKDIVHIGKGVSQKRGKEIEDEWNAGNVELLACHPASAGHGLNLQKSNAHHLAWYSQFWDFELYDQFTRRLRRQGNESKRLFSHHIAARDTVDEIIMYDKVRKNRQQGKLFSALEELARLRKSRK